jgi:hypothetical protein
VAAALLLALIHELSGKRSSRKLRQVLYLIILTLLRGTAGLTSSARHGKGEAHDEAHRVVGHGGVGYGGDGSA